MNSLLGLPGAFRRLRDPPSLRLGGCVVGVNRLKQEPPKVAFSCDSH